MTVQAQYLAYVLEQLAGLNSLRSNRMFGGVGLYSDGLFFGLIDDDTLFFKTGESNSEEYRQRNMPRFMPFPDRPEAVLGYHQVPADVIEDAETLVAWARKALVVALSSQARKAAKTVARKPAAAKAKSKPGSKGKAKAKAKAKAKTRSKVRPRARPGKARAKK